MDAAAAAGDDGSARIAVSISAKRCGVGSGRLLLYAPDGTVTTRHFGALHRLSAKSWAMYFDRWSRDGLMRMSAITGEGRDVAVLAIPAPRGMASSFPGTTTAIVAGLGFAGTVAAAALTAWFAREREKRVQALQWASRLFDQYEPAYRRFLGTWAGASDPGALRQSFEQLEREAIIPPSIKADVDRTIELLEQSNDPGEQERLARALHESMIEVLMDPMGFSTRREARTDDR